MIIKLKTHNLLTNFEAKIHLKENAVPRYVKARQVPLAQQKLVDAALADMVAAGTVDPIKHSEWASAIVPVLKANGKMRICADFKDLNSKINTEKYPLPRLDEMLCTISNNQQFCKIDLANAYLQLSVAPECKKYLVINTQKGLFRFNRLPFGLSSAPGIFQRFISQLLAGIEGVVCYLEDILICASSKAEQFEHVQSVLDRLSAANVVLNKEKCQFDVPQLDFLGYVMSEKGIEPSLPK